MHISGILTRAYVLMLLLGVESCDKKTAANSSGPSVGLPQELSPSKGTQAKLAIPITKAHFGRLGDEAVDLYTLTNKNGWSLKIITYGAIIAEFYVPDRNGTMADIVLGFDNLGDYAERNLHFGATMGRSVNRIRDAQFTLKGETYKLAPNDKPHHLNGGRKGWDKAIWHGEPQNGAAGPSLKLTYISKDGEEGYPGTVTATTTYTLTNDNELRVDMTAITDNTTVINMAHHTYWNLGGHASGSIVGHELTLFASKYTPAPDLIPDGSIRDVKTTPFDFTQPKVIGIALKATPFKVISSGIL